MAWTSEQQAELQMLLHRAVRNDGRRAVACGSKHGFSSPIEAERAMPRRDAHEHLSVYHCHYCHLWHIGSDTPRRLPDRVVKQRAIARALHTDQRIERKQQ